jgi:hypothetical protein
MRLANESDKTAVRGSPSQAQVDQLEGWLLEKPIPYISNDNFSQASLTIGMDDDLKKNTMDKTLESVLSMVLHGKHIEDRNEYQIADLS